jgi:hypothetical protein
MTKDLRLAYKNRHNGFIAGKDTAEEKSNIEKYKKEYADYWKDIIGTDGDFDLKEEKEEN